MISICQSLKCNALEILVLRAVETIGIRYARGSNDYRSALEAELRKLWNDGILRGLTRTKVNNFMIVGIVFWFHFKAAYYVVGVYAQLALNVECQVILDIVKDERFCCCEVLI